MRRFTPGYRVMRIVYKIPLRNGVDLKSRGCRSRSMRHDALGDKLHSRGYLHVRLKRAYRTNWKHESLKLQAGPESSSKPLKEDTIKTTSMT